MLKGVGDSIGDSWGRYPLERRKWGRWRGELWG